MSTTPRTEPELESESAAALEALMAGMRTPAGIPAGLGQPSRLGYLGFALMGCLFAIIVAWPVGFSAALAWWLARHGWAVFS